MVYLTTLILRFKASAQTQLVYNGGFEITDRNSSQPWSFGTEVDNIFLTGRLQRKMLVSTQCYLTVLPK